MQAEIKKFSELKITMHDLPMVGERIQLRKILDTEIIIHHFKIEESKYPKKENDKCLYLQLSLEGKKRVAFSIAKTLMKTLEQIPKENFPFSTKITNENERYEFR